MPEPARYESFGVTLELSVEEVPKSARPLPAGDEMVIKELTEDEEQLFLAAIHDA